MIKGYNHLNSTLYPIYVCMCACVCLCIITKREREKHRALLSPKWKDNLHTSDALYSTFWWCVPITLTFNHPMKVPTSNLKAKRFNVKEVLYECHNSKLSMGQPKITNTKCNSISNVPMITTREWLHRAFLSPKFGDKKQVTNQIFISFLQCRASLILLNSEECITKCVVVVLILLHECFNTLQVILFV